MNLFVWLGCYRAKCYCLSSGENTLQFELEDKQGWRARFDFRFRVQHQVKTQRNITEDPKDNSRWRYKFSSRYNIPNWELDPRLSIEFFMLDEFYSTVAYDKFRLSLGSKKRFSNTSALSFKYLFEKEVGITQPLSYHILSLRYEYRISVKEKQQ